MATARVYQRRREERRSDLMIVSVTGGALGVPLGLIICHAASFPRRTAGKRAQQPPSGPFRTSTTYQSQTFNASFEHPGVLEKTLSELCCNIHVVHQN